MPNTPTHTKLYDASAVCRAAGITHETLKNWVSRKPPLVLLGSKDHAAASRGVPNLYSLHRVLQIAIMADLVRLGWEPRLAAQAAVRFSDTNSGSTDEAEREVGELFAEGDTLLVVSRSASADGRMNAEVVNVQEGTTWTELRNLIGICDAEAHGMTVLYLSDLVPRVRRRLRLPAFP